MAEIGAVIHIAGFALLVGVLWRMIQGNETKRLIRWLVVAVALVFVGGIWAGIACNGDRGFACEVFSYLTEYDEFGPDPY